MVLHMTDKVRQSLGIPELFKPKVSDQNGFLIDWNMNLFYIGNKWFFIFTESESFYSIIDYAKPINGSEACGYYLLELINEAIIKETNKKIILKMDILSIRKTENKAPRRIMIDMIYHAENYKFKNDLKIFDKINDIPQKLQEWKSSRESFIDKINNISNKTISV